MHSLYTCNHVVYITYISMHISICLSMVYVLYSHKSGTTKLVLSINLIIVLVCSALVEPLVDWKAMECSMVL